MSPWLFNLFMDGVVRGMSMQSVGDERAWEVHQLFADDTAMVAGNTWEVFFQV